MSKPVIFVVHIKPHHIVIRRATGMTTASLYDDMLQRVRSLGLLYSQITLQRIL